MLQYILVNTKINEATAVSQHDKYMYIIEFIIKGLKYHK